MNQEQDVRRCPGCEYEKNHPVVRIHALCPLRHTHCIPMKPSFQTWLDERRETYGELDFTLSRCPWGVVLEPVPGTLCPNCDRRLFDRQFCCAFPLED